MPLCSARSNQHCPRRPQAGSQKQASRQQMVHHSGRRAPLHVCNFCVCAIAVARPATPGWRPAGRVVGTTSRGAQSSATTKPAIPGPRAKSQPPAVAATHSGNRSTVPADPAKVTPGSPRRPRQSSPAPPIARLPETSTTSSCPLEASGPVPAGIPLDKRAGRTSAAKVTPVTNTGTASKASTLTARTASDGTQRYKGAQCRHNHRLGCVRIHWPRQDHGREKGQPPSC